MMFCLRDLWDSKLDPAVTGFPLCVYIYTPYIPYIYIGIPYKYECDVYLLAKTAPENFRFDDLPIYLSPAPFGHPRLREISGYLVNPYGKSSFVMENHRKMVV